MERPNLVRAAVPGHVQGIAVFGAFREHAARPRDVSQGCFHLASDLLNLLDVGTLDFQPAGGSDTGREHLDAPANRAQ
jgi:hypothetical protein